VHGKGSCTDKATVTEKTLWMTFVSVAYIVLHEELVFHAELLHEELFYLRFLHDMICSGSC